MRQLLSIVSAVIAFGCFIPYAIDVLRGKARPARSTRLMFAFLMILALLQQRSIGSGPAIALSIGEGLGALTILLLAMWKGVGGLKRLDLTCYVLLALDLVIWQLSGNGLLALHLTVLADTIAFWPTLVKTWHDPDSETPLFWIGGAIAPLFALAAEKHLTYGVALFPLYITVINVIEVVLVKRKSLFEVART